METSLELEPEWWGKVGNTQARDELNTVMLDATLWIVKITIIILAVIYCILPNKELFSARNYIVVVMMM